MAARAVESLWPQISVSKVAVCDGFVPYEGTKRSNASIAQALATKQLSERSFLCSWWRLESERAPLIRPGHRQVDEALETKRDELLDGEIFYSLAEARIVIESWRRHYNTVRPHGSLGYKPPAPEVFIPAFAARAALQPRPATPPALADRPTMN